MQQSRYLQTAGWRENLAGRWRQRAACKKAAPEGNVHCCRNECPRSALSGLELGKFSNIDIFIHHKMIVEKKIQSKNKEKKQLNTI